MVIDSLRDYWQSENFDQLTEVYAPDALLDIYVPEERMQFRGHGAIVEFWKDDFGRPRHFEFLHWVEHPVPWGCVVETSVLDGATGDYYRWVNLVFVTADRVTQHVVYCTGSWDSAAAERWEPDADLTARSLLSALAPAPSA